MINRVTDRVSTELFINNSFTSTNKVWKEKGYRDTRNLGQTYYIINGNYRS